MKFQNEKGDIRLFKNIGEVTREDVGEECILDCISTHCNTTTESLAEAIRGASQHNQNYF